MHTEMYGANYMAHAKVNNISPYLSTDINIDWFQGWINEGQNNTSA